MNSARTSLAALLLMVTSAACTGQLPNSFRLQQQEENFSATNSSFNSKLDILWVIDNSGSMEDKQAKVRNGFVSFANRYMQPTWDIRLAVITTDTYLAHPGLANWRDSQVSGSANYISSYVNGVTANGVAGRASYTNNPNPTWGTFFAWDSSTSKWKLPAGGITQRQLRPNLTANWAKLLDNDPATGRGNHDGNPAQLCFEKPGSTMGSQLNGATACNIRDDVSRGANTGVANCVSPASGEAAVSQCVNTGINDTVHSGKSIISTYGANQNQLINDFLVNASVGVDGSGTEEGINSVLQLLSDNEAASSTTKFFRKDALRVIIFLSDEEDNSVVYPTSSQASSPSAYLVSGSACNKTVDGYSYQIYQCWNPSLTYPATGSIIPINVVKDKLDTFFRTLDGNMTGNPNYFVATITSLTAATVQQAGDQGTRYLQLGQAVGNGSLGLEIESTDYSPLLDAIGQVIVSKKGVFELSRAPTGSEEMIVKLRHADGSEMYIDASKFTVSGKILTITDSDLVLSFTATDTVVINYQPKTLY